MPDTAASLELATTLAAEVMRRCDVLATFSEDEHQLTRTFLSAPMKRVHSKVSAWMRQAGMRVRVDAIGNIIGHYPADNPQKDTPVFMMGSHLDTVRNAGKYDGMLGVLAGIAVVEALQGKRLPFGVEVIGFSEEEGVRFGATYFGSQAITGTFNEDTLALTDSEGVSMRETICAFKLNPNNIQKCAYDKKQLIGFAELHIEQGPVLESLKQPLGVVEAIIGQSRAIFTFRGNAGHAGTTPMHLRRDALTAAAAFILSVEAYAKKTPDLVATVGKLTCSPNATNVIPGEVSLMLDVRHKDDKVRRDAVTALSAKAQVIAAERDLNLHFQVLLDAETTWLSQAFTKLLARRNNAPLMVSGAGHDSVIMSAFTPTTLLFIRSPGGLSHHPDESVYETDVAVAIRALSDLIEQLELSYGV